MPTTAYRTVINCQTGEQVTETYEIPDPTPEEIAQQALESAQRLQAEIVTKVQQRLDDFAKTKNYDDILSLCTYATSTNTAFAAEGQRGVNLRDTTWASLYDVLAQVQAGTRTVTCYGDVEGDLPNLIWEV